jgi:hypothetical protein
MQVGEEQLKRFLIDSGLMTRGQLAEVMDDGEDMPLYDRLSQRNIIAEDELRRAAAAASGIPFVVLTKDDISPTALLHIPEPVSRAHNLLAYRLIGAELEVALLDLDDLSHVAELRLPFTLRPRLTTRASIKQGLLRYQKVLREKFGKLLEQGLARRRRAHPSRAPLKCARHPSRP